MIIGRWFEPDRGVSIDQSQFLWADGLASVRSGAVPFPDCLHIWVGSPLFSTERLFSIIQSRVSSPLLSLG